MMMLFLYACADKNDLSGPTVEEVYAENRELGSCEFYLCDEVPPIKWDTITDTLGIRDCQVYVTYEKRQCDEGFEVRNFDFTPNMSDPDCMDILDSIATFWLAEDFEEARDMYNSWYREITLEVQSLILDGLDPGDFSSGNTKSFQFIEVDCQTLCVDVFLDEFENVSIGFIGHTKCGESCCVRVGTWRFDLNGDAFIVGQGVQPGTGDCSSTYINCSGDYNPEMCSPACDRL
ncbi:MAG: hypothetical protein IPN79_07050 [Saprospiraceae bacterium]|nr:hypothetical protein [Saprospiraceae bacterium]